MYSGRIVFAQLMDVLPMHEFRKCVRRYEGERRVRTFSCLDQLLCMTFAQLTYRESLRDIVTCLRAISNKLYHMGIRGRISRSTIADANERRDWRIYADFANVLIGIARQLYVDDEFGIDLKDTVYALDSTTIDLCLTLFPWAHFRRRKGAVKLHTLIDLRGSIPCFIRISTGKMHDVRALDDLPIEPGAFYVMDRGYVDFARLHRFDQHKAFFITRAKRNMDYGRVSSTPVDKSTGLRSDQMIRLRGAKTSLDYPDILRRVSYYDTDNDRRFVFITNHLKLPALTIAQLYKARWRVELFFKWIKQNLRLKAFYGNSINALKTQVWIAISVYVLVAILRKQLGLKRGLTEILQILSVTLFEKTPIFTALTDTQMTESTDEDRNQLLLFDL
jgi:hypothetical protein|tara:strand:+ start:193 stop:1362 length:1170 start_codon:yes stop_codon:yes gene_type:complete